MKQSRLFYTGLTLCALVGILAVITNAFYSHPPVHAASMISTTSLAQSHPHVMPTRQAVSPHTSSPLQYHNGPVMPRTSTTYAIFWEPPTLPDGTSTYVSTNYNSLIQRYFKDIGGSGLYNNNTQYYSLTGTTTNYIMNSSSFGGLWLDTSTPYPSPSDCTDTSTPHGCMIDADIQNEITKALAANTTWSGGFNHIFFVFTSWGEGSCVDSTSNQCAFSSSTAPYCAYHNDFTSNTQTLLYANMPYIGTISNSSGCNIPQTPNNDMDADRTITAVSHEQMETVTDPLTPSTSKSGWWDVNGSQIEEIGDKCAYQYGFVTLDGGKANVKWNGHYYIVQTEWSNVSNGCTLSYANWPAFGYTSQNTRYNPFESILTATNASSLTLGWSVTTSGLIERMSSPIIVNGIVYIGDDTDTLYAYDAITGNPLWTYLVGNAQFYPSLTVVNGVAYVVDNNGNLDALNAVTGKPIWTLTMPFAGSNSSPSVVNNVIYVVGGSDIGAFNATTHQLLWEQSLQPSANGSPAIANGIAYVVTINPGTLYALDTKTRNILWSGSISSGANGLAVSNGIVYTAAFTQGPPESTNLYAFNASGCGSATCSPLWVVPSGVSNTNLLPTPAISNGIVYLGGTVNNAPVMDAFNAKTGKTLWNWTGVSGDGFGGSSAAVANGIAYDATTGGNLYAFQSSGCGVATCSPLWTYNLGNGIGTQSSPSVVNGMVYIGAYNGVSPYNGILFAFHLPT